MLEDRPYMKEPVFGPRKSITVTMLIILGACFVLQSVLLSYSAGGRSLLAELSLTGEAIPRLDAPRLFPRAFGLGCAGGNRFGSLRS